MSYSGSDEGTRKNISLQIKKKQSKKYLAEYLRILKATR